MKVTLISRIESGAFAEVWRGVDSVNRPVAVRVVNESMEASHPAHKDAEKLARVKHPNVVTVHAVAEVNVPGRGPAVGTIMELIEGETLAKRLRGARFSDDDVSLIGTGLLNGLGEIHECGITHDDLHHENVMIDSAGVKIIDMMVNVSLAELSTSSKLQRIQADVSNLQRLLGDILAHSSLELDFVHVFKSGINRDSTLGDVRCAFEMAVSTEHRGDPDVDRTYRTLVGTGFVGGEEFAKLLLEDVSQKAAVVRDLLTRLIERSECSNEHGAFVREGWSLLEDEDRNIVVKCLESQLARNLAKPADLELDLEFLRPIADCVWGRLSPLVTIQLEKILVDSVSTGRVNYHQWAPGDRAMNGHLGTHAKYFWPFFTDRPRLISVITERLEDSWDTQNYVGAYFIECLPEMVDSTEEAEQITASLVRAKRNGANLVVPKLSSLPSDWRTAIGC